MFREIQKNLDPRSFFQLAKEIFDGKGKILIRQKFYSYHTSDNDYINIWQFRTKIDDKKITFRIEDFEDIEIKLEDNKACRIENGKFLMIGHYLGDVQSFYIQLYPSIFNQNTKLLYEFTQSFGKFEKR